MAVNIVEEGDVTPGSGYKPKTDDEIRALAVDVADGRIFGSWQFRDDAERDRLLQMVFMPMLFIGDLGLRQLEADDIVHVYEYLDKASPRAINGFPIFMSCRPLSRGDAARLNDAVAKIAEIKRKFLADG